MYVQEHQRENEIIEVSCIMRSNLILSEIKYLCTGNVCVAINIFGTWSFQPILYAFLVVCTIAIHLSKRKTVLTIERLTLELHFDMSLGTVSRSNSEET